MRYEASTIDCGLRIADCGLKTTTRARHDESALRAPHSAFTLIEMLVVIAIIIALLGLLIGGIGQFSKLSNTTATKQMLAGIQTALTNYSLDWKDVPPSWITATSGASFGVSNNDLQSTGVPSAGSSYQWNGAELLAQALVAPLPATGSPNDGHAGDGFNVGSKTYGPYLELKNDATIRTTKGTAPLARHAITMASSAVKAPILYYRKNSAGMTKPFIDYSSSSLTVTPETERIWGTQGMFNTDHNKEMVKLVNNTTDGLDVVKNYWIKPPVDPVDPSDDSKKGPTQADGESFIYQIRSATYLLVGAGNDDKYGTADDVIMTGK